MRFLVVGSGGREHALAWGLSRSPSISDLLFVPGNPGMARLGECFDLPVDDVEGLVDTARAVQPDLVVIGPEVPLVAGLSDALAGAGVRAFGPGAGWARLEGSKAFAKSLMLKRGIPTAAYAEFTSSREAIDYVEKMGAPIAVKADGLAAGKGVTVCDSVDQAREAILDAMERKVFGNSGNRVVIEERLMGEELSLLAFCDGKNILPMEPAQDYKPIHDGNRGPNTGGMGSYSPVGSAPPQVVDRIVEHVLGRLAEEIRESEHRYVGVIYAGLMLTKDGPKVIEFNCRFGDPETQALIPRLESDLAEVMTACVEGSLEGAKLSWTDSSCVSVVAACRGYPGTYEAGVPIEGIEQAEALIGMPVFHAGTALDSEGRLVTSSGRVLAVSALGDDQPGARERAYAALARISFEGKIHRSDIAA